jgi:hypothetical protein
MEKLIDNVTSYYSTGIPPQVKVFKISSGQYKNRLVLIYPRDANTIVYCWSDPPYQSWSDPVDIVSDSADYPFSGSLDSDGNLYLAYTVLNTLDLVFLKLSFSPGEWNPGSVYTVCNQEDNYYPSVLKDGIDRLWVSWSWYDSATGRYSVQVKSSTDDGETWGAGPADTGTALTSGSTSCFSQLKFLSPYIICFYSDGGTKLAYRRIELSAAVWDPEEILHSGAQIDDDFHADSSKDNRVGIVFPGSSSLLYREFDGESWSGIYTVDTISPITPTLRFFQRTPFVFFGKSLGNQQDQLFFSYLKDNQFLNPLPLIKGAKPFDKVFCYDDSSSQKYYERTQEASDSTPADLFHPDSNSLVKDTDDCLFLGLDSKFNFLRMILSTPGAGGQVNWFYWDGEDWCDFVPESGAYHLDSADKLVFLWKDLLSCPLDWQQNIIEGIKRFWVKIKVGTSFTTAPVGTQITAVPECKYLNVT